MLLGTLKRTTASAVMATATHARRARRSKCPCRVDGSEARVLIPPVPRSIVLAPYLSQLHSTARPSPERYDNRYEAEDPGRTSPNPQKTNFGELRFHAVGYPGGEVLPASTYKQLAFGAPQEGRPPLEETHLPCCSRTDGRSVAQSVRSFVTKASLPSKEVSKAPRVIGKSVEEVLPVT